MDNQNDINWKEQTSRDRGDQDKTRNIPRRLSISTMRFNPLSQILEDVRDKDYQLKDQKKRIGHFMWTVVRKVKKKPRATSYWSL